MMLASGRRVWEIRKTIGQRFLSRVSDVLKGKSTDRSETVQGWVKSVRKHKKFSFVQVNDGSSWESLQLVIDTVKLPNLTTGTSIVAKGDITQGRGNSFEMSCEEIQVIGEADGASYPLQKKYHSPEFLRDVMHLRSRSNRMGGILRVRSRASQAVHDFFNGQGFLNIHTPILTSIDCEGAGEMFTLKDPFVEDTERYLSVSGQLHAEIFACSMSNVYTFGPTFRAENSNTARHLCEFYMIEPEIAFCNKDGAIDLAEACVKHVLREVMKTCKDDISQLLKHEGSEDNDEQKLSDLERARDVPFVRMSYDEAVEVLQNSGVTFEHPVRWGLSLQTEHEKYLAEIHCNRTPVFVTDYPSECKAFYMKTNRHNPNTVACFDLLIPRIGELIGGSEREDSFAILEQKILNHGGEEQKNKLKWYLDLRKYGSVPHSGWGMGFERLILFLTGTENIRDVIPVPRTPANFPL